MKMETVRLPYFTSPGSWLADPPSLIAVELGWLVSMVPERVP
jgi:hypothetical protein